LKKRALKFAVFKLLARISGAGRFRRKPIAKCLKCKTSANEKIEISIQNTRFFAALDL
jgi:hypothetical protein